MTLKPIVLLACVALALAACNTTAGMGRDMNSAGKAITNSAEDAKH
jgi:predicted small secreted protein